MPSKKNKVGQSAVAKQAKGVAKTKSRKSRKPAAQTDSPPRSPCYPASVQATPRASAEFVAGLSDMVQVDSEELQDLIVRVADLTARIVRLEQEQLPEQLRAGASGEQRC